MFLSSHFPTRHNELWTFAATRALARANIPSADVPDSRRRHDGTDISTTVDSDTDANPRTRSDMAHE